MLDQIIISHTIDWHIVVSTDQSYLFKSKSKKPSVPVKSKDQLTEENINKLLKLSKPVAHSSVADKVWYSNTE